MKVRLQIMFTPVGHCRLLGFVLIFQVSLPRVDRLFTVIIPRWVLAAPWVYTSFFSRREKAASFPQGVQDWDSFWTDWMSSYGHPKPSHCVWGGQLSGCSQVTRPIPGMGGGLESPFPKDLGLHLKWGMLGKVGEGSGKFGKYAEWTSWGIFSHVSNFSGPLCINHLNAS